MLDDALNSVDDESLEAGIHAEPEKQGIEQTHGVTILGPAK
jgi:hypothetical protein